MDGRLAKVKRIVAVQRQLHQLAEWRLAALERQAAGLREDEAATVEALNDDRRQARLLAGMLSSRLRRIGREADAVGRARAAQSERVRDEALRLKRIERHAGQVVREQRRSDEKAGFRDLLDSLGTDRDASPV